MKKLRIAGAAAYAGLGVAGLTVPERIPAYFGGSGSAGPLTVLALWSVLGLATVAAGRPRRRAAADGEPLSPAPAVPAGRAVRPAPV